MFPHIAIVVVMAFPPDALHTFNDTMPSSEFLSLIGYSHFIIACSTYSLPCSRERSRMHGAVGAGG